MNLLNDDEHYYVDLTKEEKQPIINLLSDNNIEKPPKSDFFFQIFSK